MYSDGHLVWVNEHNPHDPDTDVLDDISRFTVEIAFADVTQGSEVTTIFDNEWRAEERKNSDEFAAWVLAEQQKGFTNEEIYHSMIS